MKNLTRVVIVVVILVAGLFLFIYSGIYNVSAMDTHNALTLWLFDSLKDNSIKHRTKEIRIPNLNDSALVKLGFAHYREMCTGCHAGPGLSRDEIGQGLYPTAPKLAESIKELSPSELFWITKNGIKMTGMPAFGKTHPDEKIWAIVSFLEKLPDMTKEQYRTFDKATKEENGD